MLGRAGQRHFTQLCQRKGVHTALYAAHARQGVIVEHHHFAILRELNVQLHPIAVFHGRRKGGQAVFRHALVLRIQAAVRIVHAGKGRGLRGGKAPRLYAQPNQHQQNAGAEDKQLHIVPSHPV